MNWNNYLSTQESVQKVKYQTLQFDVKWIRYISRVQRVKTKSWAKGLNLIPKKMNIRKQFVPIFRSGNCSCAFGLKLAFAKEETDTSCHRRFQRSRASRRGYCRRCCIDVQPCVNPRHIERERERRVNVSSSLAASDLPTTRGEIRRQSNPTDERSRPPYRKQKFEHYRLRVSSPLSSVPVRHNSSTYNASRRWIMPINARHNELRAACEPS